jgi:hypothetical protein
MTTTTRLPWIIPGPPAQDSTAVGNEWRDIFALGPQWKRAAEQGVRRPRVGCSVSDCSTRGCLFVSGLQPVVASPLGR